MPIPTNTTETAQLVEVQVADYARGRVDNTVRRRLVLRMLDQRGRMEQEARGGVDVRHRVLVQVAPAEDVRDLAGIIDVQPFLEATEAD